MTRNQDTYSHGWMWLYHNKAYNNGINGLVVHKTDRVHVVGNVIWDNGKVPKTATEHRQSYAGLTVNQAKTVKVSDNIVKTELKNDYAYVLGVTSKKKSLFKDIIQIKVDHPPSYPIFDKLFFDTF